MIKWDLFLGCKGGLILAKIISVISHINKRKGKNHMIISIHAEKTWQSTTSIHDKKKKNLQTGSRRIRSQHNQGLIWKTTTNIVLNGEKMRVFPLKSETKQGCPLSPLLFNILPDIQPTAIWQHKEIKGIQFGKEEVNFYLQMTWYYIYRIL